MKPGDHPDFYRFAPPPGTSRESTIVLDRRGDLWHDGERVPESALSKALHRWLSVHPDDGRFILQNGYDWCYLRVEDTAYFVLAVSETDPPMLTLSDGTTEELDLRAVFVDGEGALFTKVKAALFWARFGRHAESDLARLISGDDPPRLVSQGVEYPILQRIEDAKVLK